MEAFDEDDNNAHEMTDPDALPEIDLDQLKSKDHSVD